MEKYILTIDQGTTSTRAMLFDKNAEIAFIAQEEVKCYFPKPGYVEQDAIELWLSVLSVINQVLIKANLTFYHIAAMGITNQRETTIVWDRNTECLSLMRLCGKVDRALIFVIILVNIKI